MNVEWFRSEHKDLVVCRGAVKIAGKIAMLEEGQLIEAMAQALAFFCETIVPLNKDGTWDRIRCEFWLDRASIELLVAGDNPKISVNKGMAALMSGNFRATWKSCAELDDGNARTAFRAALEDAHLKLVAEILDASRLLFSKERQSGLKGRAIEFWDSDERMITVATL